MEARTTPHLAPMEVDVLRALKRANAVPDGEAVSLYDFQFEAVLRSHGLDGVRSALQSLHGLGLLTTNGKGAMSQFAVTHDGLDALAANTA